jgi:hypothetical protein
MKTSTLLKRIEKLDLRKNTLVYGMINNLATNDMLRPVFSQGHTWKHSSLVDKSIELISVLTLLKLKFEIGNDAPRGGQTGYFVKIITKLN